MAKCSVKLSVSENEWTNHIITTARMYGWLVAHFRAGMMRSGRWCTPVQGDGAGFPDLVLCRDRVIFVELKSEKGRLSAAQKHWISKLEKAGVEIYVWRPSQYDEIVAMLSRTGAKCSTE